jgi:hypothetical protein
MSICVLVKVGEGLVLATDSANSVAGLPINQGVERGPLGIVKVFYTGKKLFGLGDYPIGIMSWGAGSFRERTIASFIEEYENKITVQQVPKENKDIDVREIAQEIWEFLIAKSDDIFKKVPKEHRPRTGLAVCGYTKDNFFSEEYVMQIPTSKPARLRSDKKEVPNFGANWFGQTDAIIRFHHGRDDRIFGILEKSGVDGKTIEKIRDTLLNNIQYRVLFSAMPLGDAIEYAKFLVQLTISRFRFVAGAEICGGKINVAKITRKEGFEFV